MYIERKISKTISKASASFPVVLVTGARQVGKSTLLSKLAETGRTVVSLDNPTIRHLAKSDPELFLQRYQPPVFIDEVQYAPELFPYIKIYADREKKSGSIWLSGSQMFQMMKDVTESLAGRVGVIPMSGLTNNEIRNHGMEPFEMDAAMLSKRMTEVSPMTVKEVFDRILRGSMPRLYEDPEMDQALYFESYLDTYVSRDIRELSQVGDEMAFLSFLRILAARTATNVNYEAIATEAGITAPTAKRWLSMLVTSGLVILVPPYSHNVLKRVIKAPRMYLSDTGLCAHLMGWGNAEVLENSMMSGAFFETWVVTEIHKSYLNAGKRPPLYFYRDSNRKEIDLILVKDQTLTPIEIKKASAPAHAVRNFSVLSVLEKENISVGEGAVICMTEELLPIDRKNWYVPAWLI